MNDNIEKVAGADKSLGEIIDDGLGKEKLTPEKKASFIKKHRDTLVMLFGTAVVAASLNACTPTTTEGSVKGSGTTVVEENFEVGTENIIANLKKDNISEENRDLENYGFRVQKHSLGFFVNIPLDIVEQNAEYAKFYFPSGRTHTSIHNTNKGVGISVYGISNDWYNKEDEGKLFYMVLKRGNEVIISGYMRRR